MSVVPSSRVIGVSIGTASVLGLLSAPCDVAPTTAYLLLGGRCSCDCAFCAQARSSAARSDALSRVTWPPFAVEATLDAMAEAYRHGRVARVCLQVTAGPGALAETLTLVSEIRQRAPVPVCAAALPSSADGASGLLEAGLDVLGFGLDAASEEVYNRTKGRGWPARPRWSRGWQRRLEIIERTARAHPGRVGVHLIVGLGETERELASLMQHLTDRGINVALFAFTPVPGTAMERVPPPALGVYRRAQVARFLVARGHSRAEHFHYSVAGRITDFGVPEAALRGLLSGGEAFQTSGCPDCNRPFYNERPGGTMYNYARELTADEVRRAVRETELATPTTAIVWPGNLGPGAQGPTGAEAPL